MKLQNKYNYCLKTNVRNKMDNKEKSRKELADILKSKIENKQIYRFGKKQKETFLEKNLEKIGIDTDKFKADLEALKKQGGLEINIKN